MNQALILTWLVAWLPTAAAAQDTPRIDYARDVRPLLERSCWKCHGREKQQGGLRLDSREAAIQASDTGAHAIVPGAAGESELIARIESNDASHRMPPKSDPLGHEAIQTLRAWIDQGAAWPGGGASAGEKLEMVVTETDRDHWAYRALRDVAPPDVSHPGWCRTPIDRFILAALNAQSIAPNDQADRRTLIRRVYFDLLGLPPSPEDVKAFLEDPALDAYERLIDRLLQSRHYGERWGRHWLDLARYADSDGLETDADRPTAYHYRDFVIRALNDDLSYRTFVQWQIAGDEYEPDNPQAIAATGFLAAAPNEVLTVPMEEEKLRLRFDELDDMSVTMTSAFLGLTLGCARCHDHKYDAIPTRDYYRLQCAFTTTKREQALLAPRAQAEDYRTRHAAWSDRLKAAREERDIWLEERKKPHTPTLRRARIEALPIPDDEKAILHDQPDSDRGKALSQQHEKALRIPDQEYQGLFDETERNRWSALDSEIKSIEQAEPERLPAALAIVDEKASPEPSWLLDRGDFYAKKEPLQVGFLQVLTRGKSPEDFWTAARDAVGSNPTTGQRRAVADWITDVDHGAGALLARVIVNRVWQHHLGEGLVRTVSDFGVRGDAPTHPALLEWLSHQFVASGWRLKTLHRLILTSAVYREGDRFDDERGAKDPENHLLWRHRPQRLESEILRDAVLAVSGTLNLEPYGPAFKPFIPPEAMLARNTKDPYPADARDTEETRRRTVYMFHKRVVQHPLMQAFDGPDATVTCGRRSVTTVAPQALALLNDAFLRDRAIDFARRLTTENPSDLTQQVDRAFQLALARAPTADERTAATQFVEAQRTRRTARSSDATPEETQLQSLADFTQALFSLNEFIYVD